MAPDPGAISASWVVVYPAAGALMVLLEDGSFYTAFTNRPGRPRIIADEGYTPLRFDESGARARALEENRKNPRLNCRVEKL